MSRTVVDPTLCIGCGLCEATCPNSYKIDETTLISEASEVQLDNKELLDLSVEECPVGAISFIESTQTHE